VWSTRPRRLLVVDDEHIVLRLLSRFLRNDGYEVFEAVDAEQALNTFQGSRPIDALLCDVWLNGSSGWGVAVRIRALQPHIPVLMFTGRIEVEPPPDGLKHAILNKPFGPKQLRTVLSKLW
jgi:DNA-binding response OmpR family regulator